MLSFCEADRDKAIALDGISNYFIINNQVDSAFYYSKKALQCAILAHDSILIPQMEHNLGLYYYYCSQPDSALLMEREAINHAVNDTKRRLYYGTYGGILYDLNQIDSAIYYLNASIDTTLFERHKLTTLLNLYQIEKYRGNLAEASQYLEEHVSILDSLYTEERDTEISNLIHEHKTELKVQEEKERGRRMQQLILLSASFLFLYILSAFMRYVHKKKKEKLQVDVKLHENEKQIALLQSLVSSHEEIIAQLEEKKKTLEKAHEEIIAKNEEQEYELFSNIHSLQEQIAAFHAQIEAAHKQIRLLENWQFTQTAIYQRVLELRKQASKEIPKSLNASEKNKLKTIIFSLNRKEVETIQLEYPSWTEDDILLKLLEDRTDFDAKAIAICFGIYSTHALNQRRYRMYRK